MKQIILPLLSAVILTACTSQQTKTVQEIETQILRSEDLERLTPDSVIVLLKQGNQNFASRSTRTRDSQTQLSESAVVGQAPKAIVLSCIDSRVPVEKIFDMGVGDIFVARVAGNVVNDDMLASMEYACKYIGSKIVLVLGHESCGAVNAACAGLEDGNLTELLHKIHPAVELAKQEGDDVYSKEFQSRAVAYNVEVMVDNVRKHSETLAQLESEGKIKIIGGVFNLQTGLVEFFEY
ncbi:MAG: carbonic anhydrase family protein [Rikenellaceae bacterium]